MKTNLSFDPELIESITLAALKIKNNSNELSFPEQQAFIKDHARLKALFCTRRAAKSYTGGLYLVEECLNNPGVNCLFIGLTRESARGIIWKDILKIIDRNRNLGLDFNETRLTATFPNGSVIWLAGIDTDEEEMNKLLGKKYKLCILDEASLYSVNLNQLIYGVLKPAVADYRGTICMMGTSSNITRGLFYDITTGKEPGWKLHSWTAHQNPYVAKQWQEELDDIRTQRPLFMQTALFKQWYLNQWVVDTDKLVYRFNPDINIYDQLPRYSTGQWSFVLGVDLGYHPDPSAFVVCGFHEHDKTLYLIESFKRTEMDITDVANKIKEYQKSYDIYKVIIDGANKQAVEEMRRRHDVALTAADKTGKADFIELMNAEFIQGNIKLSQSCNNLREEYQTLVWITEGDKIVFPRKEHSSLPNHLADAALYAWRYTYTYLHTKPKQKVDMKTQWVSHTKKLMDESLERQISQQKANEDEMDFNAISQMDFEENPLSYYLNKRRSK